MTCWEMCDRLLHQCTFTYWQSGVLQGLENHQPKLFSLFVSANANFRVIWSEYTNTCPGLTGQAKESSSKRYAKHKRYDFWNKLLLILLQVRISFFIQQWPKAFTHVKYPTENIIFQYLWQKTWDAWTERNNSEKSSLHTDLHSEWNHTHFTRIRN